MKLEIANLAALAQNKGDRRSQHDPVQRVRPSLLQYDYLVLSRLSQDMEALIAAVPAAAGGKALDLGCDKSPYRELLEQRGLEVRTLDISAEGGADHVGRAEATGLPAASFDLVICTQVLEHCEAPWTAAREIRRILKPGGHCILTAPHVWFYHPHPADNWRFTQEGLVRLCTAAGLEPLELRSQGGTGAAVFQILNFVAYGVLGKRGGPLFACANLLGAAADRAIGNSLFCLNFALLARAGAGEAASAGAQ